MSATGDRFREPDADPAWLDPVLVVCPRCGGRAVVRGDRRAARLVCEAYVGARLRDHTPGPAPLSARLPAWLTSARNRDEVLRHLARLRRRLDA